MGLFSSKQKATQEQLKLMGRLDAAYEGIEKDLYAFKGFIETFVERASEIQSAAPKPIQSWAVLDEVCEKCSVELMMLFSLTYSCDYLMSNTGYLRLRGFMKEAQDLAVRLDELKKIIEVYMSKILEPMVPLNQITSSGLTGVYYCFEVIDSNVDFSSSMKEKYAELDKAMKLHFGLIN